MAEHIEVVIKIPKYYLTHPQDYSCLAECVRRGVPLPKEHGRLIDADNLLNQFPMWVDNVSSATINATILKAPTIIEGSEK